MMSSSSITTTAKPNDFVDLDDLDVYDGISAKVCNVATRNFVVEFGKDDAKIAYDLSPAFFGEVLKKERPLDRPVRWM
jgi:hypothetical protein